LLSKVDKTLLGKLYFTKINQLLTKQPLDGAMGRKILIGATCSGCGNSVDSQKASYQESNASQFLLFDFYSNPQQ